MTSDRKIAANQKNATKSTGPKSALGKRRTRRNALRHGLSIGLGDDAAVVAEADLLAKSLPFVEEGGRNSLVLQLAEAELDLRRVRKIKTAASNSIWKSGDGLSNYPELNSTLAKLDRYERRALSQRKHAMRAIINATI
jgi:hypothetical protein